jgi:ribose/xylose/arabinose/galactoside ABC-type transport system permease subunit
MPSNTGEKVKTTSLKYLRSILISLCLFFIFLNLLIYLTNSVVVDSPQIARQIGESLFYFISKNLFFIIAFILFLLYCLTGRVEKKRQRKHLLEQFE